MKLAAAFWIWASRWCVGVDNNAITADLSRPDRRYKAELDEYKYELAQAKWWLDLTIN